MFSLPVKARERSQNGLEVLIYGCRKPQSTSHKREEFKSSVFNAFSTTTTNWSVGLRTSVIYFLLFLITQTDCHWGILQPACRRDWQPGTGRRSGDYSRSKPAQWNLQRLREVNYALNYHEQNGADWPQSSIKNSLYQFLNVMHLVTNVFNEQIVTGGHLFYWYSMKNILYRKINNIKWLLDNKLSQKNQTINGRYFSLMSHFIWII